MAIALSPSVADANEVVSCSRVEPSGERTLCFEVVIQAEPASIWLLWSSPEHLRSWLAPVASVDLRPGGLMEASYDPRATLGQEGNIVNRIIAVAPQRSFVMQVARPPPGFPHADEVRELATLIELESVGQRSTLVRVSMFAFREGQAFDELYGFFSRGNAWTLQKLSQRVTAGPVDWAGEAP